MAETFNERMKAVVSDDKTKMREITLDSLKELFLKYIDSRQAPLEVNIKYTTRKDISCIFGEDASESKKSVQETMMLMESAVQEIAHLMCDANIRFQASTRTIC